MRQFRGWDFSDALDRLTSYKESSAAAPIFDL